MDIRNTAFEIYMKSLDSARVGGNADELKGLSPQETAFVKRLVMTALRRQEFIKSVIRGYAAKKIPARPDAPHAAIILGAVEVILYFSHDFACVYYHARYMVIVICECNKPDLFSWIISRF